MRPLLAVTALWTVFPVAEAQIVARGGSATLVEPDRRAAGSIAAGRGASLRFRWPGPKERPGALSLLPVDVALPDGLTRQGAIRLWTRSISGGETQWSSLPAGTYRLILRDGRAGDDALPPIEISEIVLAPGDDAVLQNALPPVPPAEAERPIANLRIFIPDSFSEPAGVALSQWRAGVVHRLTTTAERLSGGILLTARAPCIPGSAVVLESGTGVGGAVLDGTCTEWLRVPLLPAAKVAARLAVPAGASMPSSASLRLAKCTGGRPPIEIPVAVETARLHASVPAGCAEMSLRAGGFAPVPLAPPALQAGETRNLGTIALPQGAAVSIQVRSARDAEPRPGVRVTAVRAHELATMRRDLDFDRLALAGAVTDSAGWVRLDGLPDEKVVFLLRAQGRAFPQITEPYVLQPGEETVLDDVRLEVPSSVFVTVVIPEALRDAVQLFAAELSPEGHSHWPSMSPITGELTPSGAAIGDVPPGKWTVRVAGRLRNGFALNAASQQIEVLPGVDQHVTLTITDSLFHGRVLHGGEPVAGVVNLKPLDRGRTAVANVGADGRFEVLLEKPGSYTVFVQRMPGGSSTRLDHPVAFEDPNDEVAIELPTGRIHGRVIDSAGTPVRDVFVSATRQTVEPRATVGARVPADGRFILDFASAGRWEVVAESKNARSEPVPITTGDGDLEDLTLILDPIEEITVRVVEQSGVPVQEASVLAEFLPPGASQPNVQIAFSRGDRLSTPFRLSPWQQTAPVNLVIRTPDGRLACATRKLDADQTVAIPAATGELRLIATQWTSGPHDQGWLVSSEGCAVGFYATSEAEGVGETAMVFAKLPAGRWTYVRTRAPRELAAVLTGRGTSLPAIRTFDVQPGKTTRVPVHR